MSRFRKDMYVSGLSNRCLNQLLNHIATMNRVALSHNKFVCLFCGREQSFGWGQFRVIEALVVRCWSCYERYKSIPREELPL